MGRRGVGLFGFVYLVIGVVVAATHGYLVAWNVPGNLVCPPSVPCKRTFGSSRGVGVCVVGKGFGDMSCPYLAL